MTRELYITSGDIAGESLVKAGLAGDVFVWHDILYDGPRQPGWPDEETLRDRALFIEAFTGKGICRTSVLKTLQDQYRKLADAASYDRIILWFDACLFDQSMLAHILMCLDCKAIWNAELICVDAFPGIEPFHGLGQLQPSQLASLYDRRHPVSDEQFAFAAIVDKAFAARDEALLSELAKMDAPALPWIPAAAARWLEELPDEVTGLGRLESLALDAIRSGCTTPEKIFKSVSQADTPPQYWGDITLWAKINGLADRVPPLVKIDGPGARLPQWESAKPLEDFSIRVLGS